ncbi:sporulation protein YqfD [Cohnella cholangitidis]|uniref:Sporulation protein YqfD n=1 Tax=Cohnella cholangitidis TaxID=2598458 RepID=A0A7G5BTZ6_9BACL|nr:sporulation protein YqfD [Cohnella cholangitidis]QMV40430.1 sporulation protein YqfD [Cohnella cholangitidis]
MKGTWVATLRGYVWVKLIGGEAEAFLNAATKEQVPLWNISYNRAGELNFGVSVPDFFRLRPLLRESGSRTRILSRHGLPFRMARLARRKTFAGGMLAFVAALFLLSTLVWDVRVEGNSAIPEEKIRQAAKEEGIFEYQWSFRLQDAASLSQRLALRLPEAAWVGVDRRGTSISITVIDSTKPEKLTLEGPRHLVAKTDAVVTRIIAENGRPKVERNDRVRKGDILISGIIGDEQRNKAVVSKGKVMGLVWHEYRIESPLVTKSKNLTGAAQERSYLIIGNRALQISGYGEPSYENSQTRTSVHRAQLWKKLMPFGTMKEHELEVIEIEKKRTPAEAKEAGLAQARAEMLAKAGKDAVIKAENILHEQTENGKVLLTVLFEVEQSIAIERPIG